MVLLREGQKGEEATEIAVVALDNNRASIK